MAKISPSTTWRITTTIFDGENPAPNDAPDKLPDASSAAYNRLRPVIQAYEAAIAENRQ